MSRLQINDRNFYLLILWMKAKGSSVLLHWSEDDNLWECSWITGGVRHTGTRRELEDAVHDCLASAGAVQDALKEVKSLEDR